MKKLSKKQNPTTKKKVRKEKERPLSDIGLRRLAYSDRLEKGKSKKRYTHWLSNPHIPTAPQSKELEAFTDNPNWRIFRIMAEFIEGFEFLDKLHNEVTIFGSARATVEEECYQKAKKLGYLLGKDGYTVITGGGPGIMEAANWGAYEAGAESVGLDISLPTEQRRNQFVTQAMGFHYFFTRKVMLSASAQAYIFFPGGFGTLDELTEMLALIQTGKITREVPAILVCKDFWEPMLKWVKTTMYDEFRYVSKKDLGLMHLVDTPEEAMKIIRTTRERPYGSERAQTLAPMQTLTPGLKGRGTVARKAGRG
jgi:uncharacterized protein (TIGR00730 family)